MQIGKNIPQWLAGLAHNSFFLLLMFPFASLFYSSCYFFKKSWTEERSTNTNSSTLTACMLIVGCFTTLWYMMIHACLSWEIPNQKDILIQINVCYDQSQPYL